MEESVVQTGSLSERLVIAVSLGVVFVDKLNITHETLIF